MRKKRFLFPSKKTIGRTVSIPLNDDTPWQEQIAAAIKSYHDTYTFPKGVEIGYSIHSGMKGYAIITFLKRNN